MIKHTGGWLFYRTSSAVTWTSNALAWHTNNGDYQFWKATIPAVPARPFQYYLQVDFDSGARTTYSHFANNTEGFSTTTNSSNAQSSPYTFTVPKATATVTLSGTNQTYNGSARPVTAATTPSGLTTSITYNGNSPAPVNPNITACRRTTLQVYSMYLVNFWIRVSTIQITACIT